MIAKGCSEGKASHVLYVSGEEWSEQKVKLNDAEHKLKDQGRQLKVQQKRIGSTKKTIHALYKKLNLPLPSTLSDPAEDEFRTGSSDDEDDNISD
ncbi:hypothetical protein HN51_066024 [Arachis hypogaea]